VTIIFDEAKKLKSLGVNQHSQCKYSHRSWGTASDKDLLVWKLPAFLGIAKNRIILQLY
jgi:hypothetical protein